MTSPPVVHRPPDLSFVLPAANENRWSDLLASLVVADPAPMRELLGVDFDVVRREVSVPASGAWHSDRLDLLLERGGAPVAVIEAKLLSDLGFHQLDRYVAAFAGAEQYRVLHLARLPVNLGGSTLTSLTWEAFLRAYADNSDHPWIRATASAWITALDGLVPKIAPDTVWNDVPDEAPGMELALRARVAWLSGRLDQWCGLEHDMVQSSGGGNWAVRIWGAAPSPKHLVTIELQDGLTAYEWKPVPDQPYRDLLHSPVVMLGLRQEPVTTSADFDWSLLHRMFTDHLIDEHGSPRDGRAWQVTPARPTHPVDRANWRAMVAAGAPRWLGKGWGMKAAAGTGACLFGARYGLPPTSTLAEIDHELRQIAHVVSEIADTTSDRHPRALDSDRS